ncbi:MAG: beta-fructosidase [Leptolyngbya sp. DLM2.Bin27]|nr:MAG: beta-fructosidase [Leptolyngbya sp. DLM2.Bin27]
MVASIQHPSRHVWDFWYYFDRPTGLFHLFYLNADRALVAAGQHHYAACVGHATTADFGTIDWGDNTSYDVLKPPAHHWANTCIWSGDIISVANGWLMFYTSRDRNQDDGLTQAIGVAYTSNLFTHQWHFFDTQIKPGSVYQSRGLTDDLTMHAWRDPFLFRQRDRGQIFMLVAAKTVDSPLGKSGAIALLRVADHHFAQVVQGKRAWDYLTPLVAPGCYAEMEVPQLYQAAGDYELVFSCWAKYDFASANDRGTGGGGFQAVTLPPLGAGDAARPLPPPAKVLLPETQGLYACRIVPELDGEIVGFDIQTGGIRRSGIQIPWTAMDRDFSDLAV